MRNAIFFDPNTGRVKQVSTIHLPIGFTPFDAESEEAMFQKTLAGIIERSGESAILAPEGQTDGYVDLATRTLTPFPPQPPGTLWDWATLAYHDDLAGARDSARLRASIAANNWLAGTLLSRGVPFDADAKARAAIALKLVELNEILANSSQVGAPENLRWTAADNSTVQYESYDDMRTALTNLSVLISMRSTNVHNWLRGQKALIANAATLESLAALPEDPFA